MPVYPGAPKPAPSDVTSTVTRRPSHITLKVNLQARDQGPSSSPRIPAQPDVSAPPPAGGAVVTARSGLGAAESGFDRTDALQRAQRPRQADHGRLASRMKGGAATPTRRARAKAFADHSAGNPAHVPRGWMPPAFTRARPSHLARMRDRCLSVRARITLDTPRALSQDLAPSQRTAR
jgi:hypothetical protein